MTTYLERLQQRRQDEAAEKQRKEQLDAVNGSGKNVVDAVNTSSKDYTSNLHELMIATLVGKDPKLVEVAERLVDLSDEIQTATANIKDADFQALSDSVNDLQQTLAELPAHISQSIDIPDTTDKLDELIRSLNKKNFNPSINVKAPEMNLKPLEDLVKGLDRDNSTGPDLGSYRAQDLEDEDVFQRVGFVNPEGNWYIIEYDTESNSMRYKFGKSKYAAAWKSRVTQTYKLLNEAYDALKA